jgi:tetratricopeptide (TPR) repeat protein
LLDSILTPPTLELERIIGPGFSESRILKISSAAGFFGLCLLSGAVHADDTRCENPVAQVDSADGRVEVRPAGLRIWEALQPGDRLCLEDVVRTAVAASATFRLPDNSLTILGEDGSMSFGTPRNEEGTLLDLVRGALVIISRDPRFLKITTPYGDAGLEGTEFLLEVDGVALALTVFEGSVELDTAGFGTRYIDGQQAITVGRAGFGELAEADPFQRELLWARHFDRVLDGPLPAWDEEPADGVPAGAAFLARRAQGQLLGGRIEQARADVDAALTIVPDHAEALSVAATISWAQRDGDRAWAEVERALAVNPRSSAALIAQSFLLQHRNDPLEALNAARQAAVVEPGNVIAAVRVAETLLQSRDVRGAVAAANEVLEMDPGNAAALGVLGFAAMAAGKFSEAEEHFDASIEADSTAPMPRLGLAIALIRIGETSEGMASLESAVALDPNDSRSRSYAGKGYFDQSRIAEAIEQLGMGSRVDRGDTTPYTYRALIDLAKNDPIAAFLNLENALRVSGGSLRFGSSFAFDDDAAMRNASYGQIYRALDFEKLGQLRASQLLTESPSDPAGHWLQADIASELERQQITRVSEARQARMHETAVTAPVPPLLGIVNLPFMDSAGASDLAREVQRSSFARNGAIGQVSLISGSNATTGANLILANVGETWSFDLSYGGQESDGFRENNDAKLEVLNAFVNGRLSSNISLLSEVRFMRVEKGDLSLLFNADLYSPDLSQEEENDSVMLGAAVRLTPTSKFTGTITANRADISASIGTVIRVATRADRETLDVQYINERQRRNFVAGMRVSHIDVTDTARTQIPLGDPPIIVELESVSPRTDRQVNAHFYSNHQVGERFDVTAGVSQDWIDGRLVDISGLSPKLGAQYRSERTAVRVSYFETVLGTQISKQMIQPLLEPTQVAGFGQFYFGTETEVARTSALAVDHEINSKLRIGAEKVERDVESPYQRIPPGSTLSETELFHIRESMELVNLYWMPTPVLAVRAGWQYEYFDYHGEISPFQFTEIRTRRVPIDVTWILGEVASLKLTGSHIRQTGIFDSPGPTANLGAEESEFPVFDASLRFRLPNRRGNVEAGIKNLFDKEFRFQDTDPENPRIYPDRFAFVRFTLMM